MAVGASLVLFSAFTIMADKKGYNTSYLNKEAQPCQDFYSYAIGGWQKANPVPSTESRWGVFNILAKQNEEKITAILESIVKQKKAFKKGSDEQLIRDLYLAALDSNKRNELGMKPIEGLLAKVDAVKNKEELWKLMSSWRADGIGGMFGHYVSTDAKSSDQNILHLSQGGLQLPDVDYYLKQDSASKSIREAYKKHMVKLLTLAKRKDAEAIANDAFQLEESLASVSMNRTERRDPDRTYNKYSQIRFLEEFQGLDWSGFFLNSGTGQWEEIIVSQPLFLKGLARFWQESSLQNLQNYLRWQIVHENASILSDDFQKENFHFYGTVLSGKEQMKPVSERAIDIVNGQLGETVGKLFVAKHFNEASKKQVALMVEELRDAFRVRIKALDWMSDTTKERALQKLDAFGYKIGYPDKWKDFSDVDIKGDDLVGNLQRINRKRYGMMMAKLGKPVDKTEWGMTPQTVNAYYSSSKNEIVFPAGILQPPFFDPNAEDALNYGGIGAVIGHEFSHGFDDKGSKYDGDGNLNNWWTDSDRAKFKVKTDQIVKQFNRFEVLPGVNINGELTQGENIADLAGLTLAFHALELHYGKNAPKAKGADGFTWQQRFFLGWAQVWAQNMNEKELRRRIITDPHSPGQYRVNGPLSNLKEFWDAFGCEIGTEVHANEAERVLIW